MAELVDNVLLVRDYKGEDCTLGKIFFGDNSVESLELPWKDNEPRVSCIPDGEYEVEKTYSPAFKKKLWLVKNVPNRSGIRIHTANFVSQLLGCIAPGLSRHDLNGDGIIDITNSKKAIGLMNGEISDKFTLTIKWADELEINNINHGNDLA